MAVSVIWPNSFKHEVLNGTHNLNPSGGDTFKIALFTSAASLSAATTAYSATNEASGTGYSAGGASTTPAVSSSGSTGFFGFADYTWSSSSITARYALIYNTAKSNKAVCVIDFGADQISSSGNFFVDFPVSDASNALFRF